MKRDNIEIKDFDSTALHDPFGSVPPELRSLLGGYLGRRQVDVQDLLGFLAGNNFCGIRDVGHRLKGSGAGYGFAEISELGAVLEAAGKDGDRTKAQEAALRLATITEDLIKRNV